MSESKSVARLEAGDRIIRTPKTATTGARRIYTVDHITRLPYGVVRVFYGHLGLQSFDAAGTHRFQLAGPHRLQPIAPATSGGSAA